MPEPIAFLNDSKGGFVQFPEVRINHSGTSPFPYPKRNPGQPGVDVLEQHENKYP